MNQQFSEIWQHSPSTIQVASIPVKEVPKSLQYKQPSVKAKLSPNDLLGLSWVLFEEKEGY